MLESAVQWGELLSILKWIVGGVAVLTVTILSASLGIIWAGGRWSQRIEDALHIHERTNTTQHRYLWSVLRQMHPDSPALPEKLPGDTNGA